MKVFEANISYKVSDFLFKHWSDDETYEMVNKRIYEEFGIVTFLNDDEELQILKEATSINKPFKDDTERGEYGDFQTNIDLATKVTTYLASKGSSPEIVVEPTCGKGSFIIASLQNLKGLKTVYGIEIYKPYVWEVKFNIIEFFLENASSEKPDIHIENCNVFDFDFKQIEAKNPDAEILIIGNPPWVTNAKLGSLNSTNLPQKTNFKKHVGLDAMTGKGNFDIAEFITLIMLDTFQKMKGNLVLLVKNSVIKNIVFDQYKNRRGISELEKHCINSKKEFNVSVEASLLYCKLKSDPEFECKEFDFYNNKSHHLKFGWVNDKFVSNIDLYIHSNYIDGRSPFVWRQGIKHDCSAVMELDKVNGEYVNGLKEKRDLEDGLIYGILKSSDLKNTVIKQTRKFTIVTQKKVGQETKYIQTEYPETYQYLIEHLSYFEARKSSIYNNKPSFSIFGIGDYSFKPYKVAIAGLYKTYHFTLVLPQNDKPIMLDDTCYFIGFDRIEFSIYALILLNSKEAMELLRAITFADAKRTFTKDVLMRIDLLELAKRAVKDDLNAELVKINAMYSLEITLNLWDEFITQMTPVVDGRIEIFS